MKDKVHCMMDYYLQISSLHFSFSLFSKMFLFPVGFDWSSTNDLLLSGGEDGVVCLWSSSSGECLRTVSDQSGANVLSCVFHPFNSNWAVVSFIIIIRVEC